MNGKKEKRREDCSSCRRLQVVCSLVGLFGLDSMCKTEFLSLTFLLIFHAARCAGFYMNMVWSGELVFFWLLVIFHMRIGMYLISAIVTQTTLMRYHGRMKLQTTF